jgi:Skp family chaperone for outer membrane proteins
MRLRPLAAPVALLLLAAPALAQSKVAVVNPTKILNGLAETKNINNALSTEQGAFTAEGQKKQQAIKDLEAQRDQVKPESPQYVKLTQDLNNERAKLQVWAQTSMQDRQRRFIQTAKELNEKISAAIAEVAQKKGFDLVMADQRPEVPPDQLEKMQAQQILAVMFGRNIMYAADSTDITQEVIATLDAKYKAK